MISLLLNSDGTDRRASVVSLVIAFAIASFLFKFGSFALECLAFLATWTAIDFIAQRVAGLFGGKKGRDSSSA
jgi:uncharacterized membrane protein